MYRFFIAVFIFSIKTGLVFAQGEYRLVEVYCSGLFGEGRVIGTDNKSINAEWGKLIQNLETRSLSDSNFKDMTQSSEYRKCLDEHEKDLELGEFIVNGLSAIRLSRIEFKGAASTGTGDYSVSPSVFEESREISTHEYTLSLENENQALVNYETMKIELELREQHYRVLWQQFMGDLKQKTFAKVALTN